MGEVVGPDRGGVLAGVQLDTDVHSSAGQVDELARVAGRALAADGDAVDGDVQVVRVEGSARRTDGGEDASPVGVVAEQRALEQVVPGDGSSDLDCVVVVRGAADLDRDLLGGALG